MMGWPASVLFHVDPRDRPALAAAGLDCFDAFMSGDFGGRVSRGRDKEVRLLNLPRYGAYLKRSAREPLARHATSVLRGARPRSMALREVTLIHHLHRAEIPVARPIAWGERRYLGVPGESFILSEAVPGQSLHVVLASAGEGELHSVLESFGTLLGRLHAGGFFHIVRPKDIIVTPEKRLVLIDREVAAPWPRRFSSDKCCYALARCEAKMLRAGQQLAPDRAQIVRTAYLSAIAPRWAATHGSLAAGVDRHLRVILSGHRYRRARGTAGSAHVAAAPGGQTDQA
jgi:hypothetical protein